MPKVSREFAAVLIIIICVTVVYGTKRFIGLSRKNIPIVISSKVKGNDDAPIKVTEFLDFQCSACAYGAAYLKKMIEKYPTAIRLELKHYPLRMHRHGFLSSRYAECAARQGKFWPFQDLLLARQGNWQRIVDAQAVFERIADEVSLNKQELMVCLQDKTLNKDIERNKTEGKILGVHSTPTYFINGKMVVGSKWLVSEITKLLTENGY